MIAAPSMCFGAFFHIFGWVLVATATALLLLPWRLHSRFAGWAIPLALRHLRLHALGSLLLGLLTAYGALAGSC